MGKFPTCSIGGLYSSGANYLRSKPYYDDMSLGRPGSVDMIILTKINNAPIAVNADLIQYIEETPDTVITMSTSDKVVVREAMEDVIKKVVHYRRLISGLVELEYERQS
jgi:flagellar protein FlbD